MVLCKVYDGGLVFELLASIIIQKSAFKAIDGLFEVSNKDGKSNPYQNGANNTHCDELKRAMGNGAVHVDGELLSARCHVAEYHFLQAGFMDGNVAIVQDVNSFRVEVQA